MDKITLNKTARDRARGLSGQIAWPTILLGVLVIPAYWSIPYLVVFKDLSLWLAIPLMVLLTYTAYTVLHESVHGLINGSHKNLKWLNEGMGYLAGTVLMATLTAHRPEHLSHHGNTNHGERDPDKYAIQIVGSLREILGSVWDAIAVQYREYMENHWNKASAATNLTLVTEVLIGIGLRVLPFVLIFSTNNPEIESGWWRLLILFAVSGFIGIYVLVYLFAYIVHRPHTEKGRYKDTSTIIVPGPLSKIVTFFWGFQNYHSIHHLFPSVPFYRYRQLFSNIAEIMDVMEAPVYRLTSRGLIKSKAVEERENR